MWAIKKLNMKPKRNSKIETKAEDITNPLTLTEDQQYFCFSKLKSIDINLLKRCKCIQWRNL